MITAGDFLAGGGGVTHAMTKIDNMKVLWVLNHNQMAIRTNMFNHKGIKHYWSDFYKQDEHEIEPVDFIWASIECTQHSKANGGKDKKIGSYTLGWELVRYIKHLNPFVIGIENVPEFKNWAPIDDNGNPIKKRKGEEFEKWKNTIRALGYDYNEFICNAADFGIPTRRIRYFAFFTRKELNIEITWPKPTHHKTGANGLKKWVACKSYINLENEGNSIFGREFNPNVKKGKRSKLSINTLRRIAGGIKKYAPDLYFILHYYSNGTTSQSINNPLHTIPTNDRHALVTLEKFQFIQDYCRVDIFNKPDEPIHPQLTWQTKQLVSAFISNQYNSNGNPEANNQSINEPLKAITSQQKQQFISHHYGIGVNQKLEEPIGSLTTHEKIQFITTYFNSNNNPESQNQDLDNPLGSILTAANKKALVTAIENRDFDFDIKMRFLDPEELSRISTFPEKYFTNPLLKLSKKDQVRLIGNAVPPEWAKLIIEPVVTELNNILSNKKMVI